MAKSPFFYADITNSTSDGGEIRVNLGDSIKKESFAAEQPVWGMGGFFYRPRDPDATGAAEAVYVEDGHEKIVLATRDNRLDDTKVGSLGKGDRAIIGEGEARIFIKDDRDAISLFTVSQPDDDNMTIDMDGSAGTLLISCGQSYIKITNDSILIGTAGGYLEVGPDGVSAGGQHFACNTGSGHLGLMVPAPPTAPMAPARSIVAGPTGMAGIGSLSWTVSI